MNTNQLRELAVELGAEEKTLYGTSKQALIVIVSKLEREQPYIVTFGEDVGDAESGPIIHIYEDLVYASSEKEACRKWEADNPGASAGTARLITRAEAEALEEEYRHEEEDYEYAKAQGWVC